MNPFNFWGLISLIILYNNYCSSDEKMQFAGCHLSLALSYLNYRHLQQMVDYINEKRSHNWAAVSHCLDWFLPQVKEALNNSVKFMSWNYKLKMKNYLKSLSEKFDRLMYLARLVAESKRERAEMRLNETLVSVK